MTARQTVRISLIVGLLVVVTSAAGAQVPHTPTGARSADSAAAAGVVTSFHNALAAGDSLRALSLLDTAVVILESGDQEHLAEYRAHHLAADIEFARATQTTSAPLRASVSGDVAWVTGTGITRGTFRGRAVNSSSAELMVLTRANGQWRITAIHWSSHVRRSP